MGRFVLTRRRFAVMTVVFAGAAVAGYPAMNEVRKARALRQCYANTKTLAGAMEMYNLDK
jgi:hypothetical protein